MGVPEAGITTPEHFSMSLSLSHPGAGGCFLQEKTADHTGKVPIINPSLLNTLGAGTSEATPFPKKTGHVQKQPQH